MWSVSRGTLLTFLAFPHFLHSLPNFIYLPSSYLYLVLASLIVMPIEVIRMLYAQKASNLQGFFSGMNFVHLLE